MARPYDPGEERAAAVFDRFPTEVQEDALFQRLFENLFDPGNNWVEAHEWHDSLDDYLSRQFYIDLDYYFDWEDWRENYDLTH